MEFIKCILYLVSNDFIPKTEWSGFEADWALTIWVFGFPCTVSPKDLLGVELARETFSDMVGLQVVV